MNVDGRVALITGGKRIGAVVATELARAGADVALVYNHSKAEAEETARAVGAAGQRATVIQANLRDPDACQRVVDATEDRYYPSLPPPRPLPLTQSVPAALKLLGASLLLNLVALPAYFVPLLNLPVWLAVNGYLVGREYAELVASRRLAPATATRLRRDNRLVFWLAGAVIAFLLAVPLLNLVAPVVGAAFMTMRFQRYCGEATNALREVE